MDVLTSKHVIHVMVDFIWINLRINAEHAQQLVLLVLLLLFVPHVPTHIISMAMFALLVLLTASNVKAVQYVRFASKDMLLTKGYASNVYLIVNIVIRQTHAQFVVRVIL
jgi:hypothetical protein